MAQIGARAPRAHLRALAELNALRLMPFPHLTKHGRMRWRENIRQETRRGIPRGRGILHAGRVRSKLLSANLIPGMIALRTQAGIWCP